MVCKARFQGPASSCSRWPFASFTLSGFTNPVRLHPVYPCISALISMKSMVYDLSEMDLCLNEPCICVSIRNPLCICLCGQMALLLPGVQAASLPS